MPSSKRHNSGLALELARTVLSAEAAFLSEPVIDGFRRSLLDIAGCMIGASRLPATSSVLETFRALSGVAEARVLGSRDRLAAPSAAFINGVMAHGLDFDEGHTSAGCHPAAVIFPAAFAVAQSRGCGTRDLMLAVVSGYEVMVRLSLAIHPESARTGWHNTGVAGVFGAAAAAGRLLGLDAPRLASAFGLALSMAGGTLQYQDNGADTKRLHAGRAAHDGILAALLARAGLRGPDLSLEGSFGFTRLFARREVDRGAMLNGGWISPMITASYFKPFAGNRHLHAALDVLVALRQGHGFGPADIDSVQLNTYSAGVRGHTHTKVSNLLDAQSSLPFMAALVLVKGRADPATIAGAIDDGAVVDLAARIKAHVDPACDALYPQERSARGSVILKDGRQLEHSVVGPKGEHDNPLSWAELEAKFRGNCEGFLAADRIEGIVELAGNCSEASDLGELFRLAETATG